MLDLPLIAWLTLIWVLLWSTLTWANVITGLVVSVAVCLAFPLPRVDLGLRLHPGASCAWSPISSTTCTPPG